MMRDIAASASNLKAFKFVVGGTVSAERRDAVEAAAVKAGITSLTIWSGVDFEEHLRLIGEDILRRFCDGDPFPDRPDELCHFVSDFPGLTDIEALAQMAVVFQRPVFQTCFHEESSLPAFQTAIEDTIAALNTGVWRTREGETIRRIPSLHHLRNPQVKAKVRKASELVDKLRRTFIAGLRDKTIRPCGCGNPSCPTFMIDRTVAASLDDIRKMALDAFREAYSPFDVHLQ